MLRCMTSIEISEWMAYYSIKKDDLPWTKKTSTFQVLRAMFAKKIVKGNK